MWTTMRYWLDLTPLVLLDLPPQITTTTTDHNDNDFLYDDKTVLLSGTPRTR